MRLSFKTYTGVMRDSLQQPKVVFVVTNLGLENSKKRSLKCEEG